MDKKRIVRTIRNVTISVAVLLVVLVGAGLAYTWFMGRTVVADVVIEEDDEPKATTRQVEQAANVPQSASVQSLTSPVVPGNNALITVKTNPGSWCTITVEYDEVASTDSGLKAKTADEFGIVSWTWTVEASRPTGKWPVTVTCLRNELSAVVVGDLIVANSVGANEAN